MLAGGWLAAAAAVVWNKVIYGLFRMPCLFYGITGWYCPGCGGTRAIKYLMEGCILMSVCYHPLVFYTVIVVLTELMTALVAKVTKKPRYYLGKENLFIWIGAAVVLINWLVKNILLVGLGIDLLSAPLQGF